MTRGAITCSVMLANVLALGSIATADINPILESIQNGASVAAIMGIFFWREVKKAERYEHLYDEERKLRIKAEHKCTECVFVQRANAAFLDGRTSEKK